MNTVERHVQKLYRVQERLKALRGTPMTWREIAALPEFHPVPAATLCAVLKHGRYPTNSEYCKTLGLPVLHPAPACPTCGIVHVSKRCPERRKQIARWRDLPTAELKWAIENRKDYNP